MAPKPAAFPGFTALNDQIFVREAEELAEGEKPSPGHPRVVVVFSWGDAHPKHVAKYTDGYRKLYPHAKQIAILSPIYKAMAESLEQRADSMKLAVEAAFPSGSATDHEGAVLTHGMSNTGGINYGSFIYAYRQLHNRPMPHHLAVWDSCPGTPYMTWETLRRWANATAMGLAPFLPLPFVVTQCLAGLVLAAHRGWQNLTGTEPAPVFSCKAARDPAFAPKSLRSLFFYGKDDSIIHPHEIEHNIAAARAAGYESNAVMFEGSDHVGHMRLFPDKYWGAIQAAWKETA